MPYMQVQPVLYKLAGEAYIIDPVKSLVAEKIGMKSKGEYAIKVR